MRCRDGIAQAYENMRIDRVEQERRKLHDRYAMELRLRQHEAHAAAMSRVEHERKRQHAEIRALYPEFVGSGEPSDAAFAMIGSRHTSDAQDAFIQADPRAVAGFLCVSGDSGEPQNPSDRLRILKRHVTVAGHVIEQVIGSQSSYHVNESVESVDKPPSAHA